MGPIDMSESREVGRRKCLGALVNSAQEPPAKGPVGLGLELPTTGLGRSPGEGKGYPLHYFGLEKSMDRIVHGVSKSRTRLRDFKCKKNVNGAGGRGREELGPKQSHQHSQLWTEVGSPRREPQRRDSSSLLSQMT